MILTKYKNILKALRQDTKEKKRDLLKNMSEREGEREIERERV